MHPRFKHVLRAVLLGSRWGMAPFCLGLIGALLLLVAEFFRKLGKAAGDFGALSSAEITIVVLKLVDLALVANLVVIIVAAGVEIFLPTATLPDGEPTEPMLGRDFSALKFKVIGSVIAIAAIELLESYVDIEQIDKNRLLWEIVALLAFGALGVLLALMDRLSAERH